MTGAEDLALSVCDAAMYCITIDVLARWLLQLLTVTTRPAQLAVLCTDSCKVARQLDTLKVEGGSTGA